MTINNPEYFVQGLWDWAVLDGCFGRSSVRVTDVDGLIERHGKFLFIETKHPGVRIPKGQEILHNALVQNGAFTVLVIWGTPGKPEQVLVRTSHEGQTIVQMYDVDLTGLRNLVERWYRYANTFNTLKQTIDYVPQPAA